MGVVPSVVARLARQPRHVSDAIAERHDVDVAILRGAVREDGAGCNDGLSGRGGLAASGNGSLTRTDLRVWTAFASPNSVDRGEAVHASVVARVPAVLLGRDELCDDRRWNREGKQWRSFREVKKRPLDGVAGQSPKPGRHTPVWLALPSLSAPPSHPLHSLAMHLAIRGVSKTYPNGVRALGGITLDIPAGMFGLLGPNGAGKSTLMRTIATLQEPDIGHHHARRPRRRSREGRVRETLGYLPQEFGVYPNVSAERLLDHFAVLKGSLSTRRPPARGRGAAPADQSLGRAARSAGRLLGRHAAALRHRRRPARQSAAHHRRRADGRTRPGGTRALPQPAQRDRRATVVILSTHIVEDVAELCSRMAIIDQGEILLEAEPLAAIAARADASGARRCQDGAAGDRAAASRDLHEAAAGRTLVHVDAASRPGPEFEPVEPDLEDVYFSVMTGHQHGETPRRDARRDFPLRGRVPASPTVDVGLRRRPLRHPVPDDACDQWQPSVSERARDGA